MKKIPTNVLFDIIQRIEKREPVNIMTCEFLDLLKEVCELREIVKTQNYLLYGQTQYINKFIDSTYYIGKGVKK